MNKIKITSIVACTLVLGGCSAPLQTHDEFSGKTTIVSKPHAVAKGFMGNQLEVQLTKTTDPEGNEEFGFKATANTRVSEAWQHQRTGIYDGESLHVMIDGQTRSFSSKRGGENSRLQPGLLTGWSSETAFYSGVSKQDMLDIINGSEVKFKLDAERGDFVIKMSDGLRRVFATFIHENVDSSVAVPKPVKRSSRSHR